MNLIEEKLENIAEDYKIRNELHLKEQILIQQSKLSSMGEMLANISHQLKQPLSVISTLSSSLSFIANTKDINPNTVIEFSDKITNQTKFISDTIEDFRDFLKPYQKNEIFNVKVFLEKCILLVNSSFKNNKIETITELDSNINSYGNPNYLIQAILNILNNAKDALELVKDIREKLVFVFLIKKVENTILIEVKDNAGGIPTDIISKVFDPYFTTKNELNGTGIGFYMTKEIITKKLKGSIEVKNVKFNYKNINYTGAKFLIKLPFFPINNIK